MENKGTVHVLLGKPDLAAQLSALLRAQGYCIQLLAPGVDLLASIPAESPSCLILEPPLRGPSSLELLRRILAIHRGVAIILVGGRNDAQAAVKAIKHGACEYLTRPFAEPELLAAVAAALEQARARWQRQQVTQRINRNYNTLTPREREVLQYVVRGFLNKQTAHEIGTAEITVRIHRVNIMRKMQAPSLAHLVRQAVHLGI